MQRAVVLDKSFLQGAPRSRVHALAESHRLVMSDALFYELLTGSEPGRSRCFAKLPQTDNPVDLVNHIGTLIRREIDTHKPAGRPSAHREELRFQFNPALLDGAYQLPSEAQQVIDEQFAEIKSDVVSFVERASGISSFFPSLLVGSQQERAQARAKVEKAIVAPGSLIEFYASLEPPPGQRPFPPASLIDESWALYRWLQIQFLFAVDLYVRYQGNIPKEFTDGVFERIEHDVLDAQVLMLGCLEGAFATREKKLKSWWSLLRPDGELFE